MGAKPHGKIPPHLRRLLLAQIEKERKKRTFILPLATVFLCLFCSWLIYRSINPLLPIQGEPPRFYSNQCQNDLRLIFTTALKSARTSIHLVMFGLTDLAILRTLEQRVKSGIPTTVYYDPTGSSQVRSRLRGAQIHPVQRGGLMHQKILILDQDLIFIGSANMTTSSLRMHDNLVVGMRSRSLANFLLEHPPYTPGYLHTMIGGQEVELWLLPDPRGNVIGELRRFIRNAARSVKIALFTFTHPALCEELIAAHKRGVAVSIVVDMHSGLGASAKAIEQLRMAGVPVFLSQGLQLLHHKFLMIDDQTVVCGSANWTKAALTKNSDCILVLHQLSEDQKKFMKDLWRRISTEAVEKRN